MSADTKKNLQSELAKATKIALQSRQSGSDEPLSVDTVTQICTVIEAIFIHGLKDTYFIRGTRSSRYPEPNIWPFVQQFSHRSTLAQIKKLGQIKSDVGRGRVWLRITLNEGVIEHYVSAFVRDRPVLRKFYNSVAFLRDHEKTEILINYLKGLCKLTFNAPTNSAFLNSWTPTPLVFAGLITERGNIRSPPTTAGGMVQMEDIAEDSSIEQGTAALDFDGLDDEEGRLVQKPGANVRSFTLRGGASSSALTNSGSYSDDDDRASTVSHMSIVDNRLNEVMRAMGLNTAQSGTTTSRSPSESVASDSGRVETVDPLLGELPVITGDDFGGTSNESTSRRRDGVPGNAVVVQRQRRKKHRLGNVPGITLGASPLASSQLDVILGRTSPSTSSTVPKSTVTDMEPTDSGMESALEKSNEPTETMEMDVAPRKTSSEVCLSLKDDINIAEIMLANEKAGETSTTATAEPTTTVKPTATTPDVQVQEKHAPVAIEVTNVVKSLVDDVATPSLQHDVAEVEAEVTQLERKHVDESTELDRILSPIDRLESPIFTMGVESPSAVSPMPSGTPESTASSSSVRGNSLTGREWSRSRTESSSQFYAQLENAAANDSFGTHLRSAIIAHRETNTVNAVGETQVENDDIIDELTEAANDNFNASINESAVAASDGSRMSIAAIPPAISAMRPGSSHAMPSDETFEIITPRDISTAAREWDANNAHRLRLLQNIAAIRGLDRQHFKCPTCRRTIGAQWDTYRVCTFDGFAYCTECHRDDAIIVPAHLIYSWDARPQRVSRASRAFIEHVGDRPLIRIDQCNPTLYSHVPSLSHVHDLRVQLSLVAVYLLTCKETIADDLRKRLWPKEYLYDDVNQYSINDLHGVLSGTLAQHIERVIKHAIEHVYGCVLCTQKAFVCEICNDPHPIFAFQTDTVYRCEKCCTAYHRLCMRDGTRQCPKCVRRADYERKKKTQHMATTTLLGFDDE